jgi:transcriptional regulator with XRE-family HTH domain
MSDMIVPTAVKEVRQALGLSQKAFGEVLWQTIHGSRYDGAGRPYTRGYVSKIEAGTVPITAPIARAVSALAARMDGADDVLAQAREASVLAVNQLPPGTVVLGQARRCAVPGCPVTFVPLHPRQKYHSRMCAALARRRAGRPPG